MSENETATQEQQSPPQPGMPMCPYCLVEPFQPQAIPFNTENGIVLLIFFCGSCRKTINAMILKTPQPRVAPPGMIMPPPNGFRS